MQEQRRFVGHAVVGASFVFLAAFVYRWAPFVVAAVVGYLMLMVDSFLRRSSVYERATNFRVGSALVLLTCVVLPLALSLTRSRQIQDDILRSADLALGLDGFALSRFCLRSAWSVAAVLAVYGGLPLVMALAWAAGRSQTYLRAAVIAAAAAFPLYLLFPAVGPQHVFAGWPSHGATFDVALAALHPRNCMPSLHFSWAAIAALNARRWRWAFAAYAALMAAAVVASGEHYVVDVLAAVPFVALVQRAAAIDPARIRQAAPWGSRPTERTAVF